MRFCVFVFAILILSAQGWAQELGNFDEPVPSAEDLFAEGINVYQEFPVVIVINKDVQRLLVYHHGQMVNEFKTSTGREEMENPHTGPDYVSNTPNGWYAPRRYVEKYHSKSWNATMRYSIFFTEGMAIHATSIFHYMSLGNNTSHGCVRLTRGNAKWLWDLARSEHQTQVPYFSRSGQILLDSAGRPKRHLGSPVLIIIKGH